MESYDREFSHFSDQLRLQTTPTASFSSLSLGDSIWSPPLSNSFAADQTNSNTNMGAGGALWKNSNNNIMAGPGLIGSGKLAFGNATTNNADRYNYFPASDNKTPAAKNNDNAVFGNNYYGKNMNTNTINFNNSAGGDVVKSYFNKSVGRPANNNNNFSNGYGHGKKNGADGGKKKNTSGGNNNGAVDRRFKSLPASEALPRNEAIGGYIFVCNNDTMEENLKRQLFGLPSRYRDSVRAIRPGLPLFLYNYSTHQLHGIFEAASFGGSNIDPTAWEDKKCSGESRFPAQVRVATRKICDPLEEDAFRPILHHYDGPKFRLELSVAEALSLLDIFAEKVFA